MIRNGEEGWEEFVPHKVADEIKSEKRFHYKEALKI
jgi:hypothetical protein